MSLRTDLWLALRTWRQAPALGAVMVLTLALGIGATTTAFTLVYSVLARPLPFPTPERLVWVTSYDKRAPGGDALVLNSNRMPQFMDWVEHLSSFDQIAAWSGAAAPDVFTVNGVGFPERVNGLRVTQQLFPMLGGTPVAGSLFRQGDDVLRTAPTVVLSHGYWQRRFGARQDVVGTSITIENVPHSVIGVLSPRFPLPGSLFTGASFDIDVYLPLELDPNLDIGSFMTVLGRLRPGVTIDAARAELEARQAAMAVGPRQWMLNLVQDVTPLPVLVTREARPLLLLLFGGVGCVLLLGCANVANLLLVRASGRRREMQVRVALGATTRNLLRQMLVESAVPAAAGGAAGVVLAVALTQALRSTAWMSLAKLSEVSVGWTAVAFALTVCAAITLIFGSLPLLHLRRRDLMDALRQHVGVTLDRRAVYAQRLSLAAQVSFALLLTATSGLLLRSLAGLLEVDPGFTPRNVIAMRVDPAGRLPLAERLPFFNALLEQVAAVPGVEAAALTINLPMDRDMGWDAVTPGQPYNPATDGAFGRIVSPGYFRAVGIRTIEGRDFDARDVRVAPAVVAINQTLALRVAATGRDPLGATLVVNGTERRVVAIVADVKHRTLEGESGREVYIPQAQGPAFFQAYDLVVRAANPPALVSAIRDAIWRVDREQAIGAPIELQQLIDRRLRPRRLLTWVVSGFAGTALVLAALGVFGVVGYRIAQRRKEAAILVALGCPGWRVTVAMLRESLALVALGLLVGIPMALGAGTAVQAYLFGVESDDLPTLGAAAVVVFVAAAIAAYAPARRVPHMDPMATLRVE